MVQHVAAGRSRTSAVRRGAGVAWSLLVALLLTRVHALEALTPPKPDLPKPPAAEKPKGPEHNVTLMEEPGVTDLFNKAAKARARAEKEPEAWPECVKCYADILKKYPNTVYLDKWEGSDKDHPLTAYKNGLYKSTRERVATEIASLPPAALTVYRVVNESAARALYLEAQEQFDEAKMEQLARDFVQTSWSNDALAWLGEYSYERGATRDAVERLRRAAASPGKTATPMSLLARSVLAQLRLSDKAGATQALAAIEEALKNPANGTLRIGADEGSAAIAKMKARIEALTATAGATESADSAGDWTTYYGNASHTQTAQPRDARGLRKWSVRITDLLYGNSAVTGDTDKIVAEDGTSFQDGSINQQLTVKDGYFYLNNGQVYAAYPISDPGFGSANSAGRAKYRLPAENAKAPPAAAPKTNRGVSINGLPNVTSIVQHPYFTTIAGDRAYGILGTESFAQALNFNRGVRFFGRNGQTEKPAGPSNYPVCIGRGKDGPEILWSLKPSDSAFLAQSKADQEWLQSAYFVSSPTYESGVLYDMAVVMPANTEGGAVPLDAWAAAFDAETGRLLWRTQICTSTPIRYGAGGGPADVQPDRGLPVAVANRTVYVVTNLGAVAALDAGGGAIKWIRIYDRTKTSPDQMWNAGEVSTAHDFWAPNPPIVYKNRLIVTPQDSTYVYGYDVDTGARVWEQKCMVDQNGGDAGMADATQGSYKHALGVASGALVLTGKDVLFLNAINGKTLAAAVPVEGTIKGRGALTDKRAWISTDKELLSIDMSNEAGKFKVGDTKAVKWTDPKVEAGSVYSAGGALYTVSHTHINAYIVWEELEAKLLERLKTEPENVATRLELADIYRSIERFDQSLSELEKARALAVKIGGPKSDEALAAINAHTVDAYMGLGEKARAASKNSEALDALQKAYDAASAPGLPAILPVLALKAQAEIYEGAGNRPAAAQAYQRIIAKHGDAMLTDQPRASKMARLYAQVRQAQLKKDDPAALAAIDAEARAAFTDAGTDVKKLTALIALYPNSDIAISALLTLARTELPASPDRARLDSIRLLSGQRTNSEAAQALAVLAMARERLGLLSAAHDAMLRLTTNDEFKGVKASLQGIDAKAPAGEVVLQEWAAKRLEEPLYQRAPSQAVFSTGPGIVNSHAAWSKSSVEGSIAMIPDGVPPIEMRRAVFYIEAHSELSAVDGRDGFDLWKPRPTAPPNSRGRAFWWERLLIVCGESNLVAYDSADNGKVAWTRELNVERGADSGYWAQISGDRLIVAHSGNVLLALDPASGGELWSKQLQASQMSFAPACGEGFAVIASANSNKLVAYNLETGSDLWTADTTELRTAPVVSGDRVFVAQRSMKLSALDAKTGKRAGDDVTLESPPVTLRAAGDVAIVSLENHTLSAYRIDAKSASKIWQVLLPTASSISDFVVDGDDLLVTSTVSQSKYEMTAFSIKAQGKMKWKQGLAADAVLQLTQMQRANGMRMNNGNGRINIVGNGRIVINGQIVQMNNNGIDDGAANFVYGSEGSGGWLRENVTRDALVLLQSTWDITGNSSKAASLVDRATGKLIWSAPLRNEQLGDGTIPLPRIQLFDGGIVVSEPHVRSGYCAPRAGANDDDLKTLTAAAAKNPNDLETRMKLATAVFDKGDREKALNDLVALLSDSKTTDSAFAIAYVQFATLRKDFLTQQRATLSFQRVTVAPDVSGKAAGWDAITGTTLDQWQNVFLASEDASSRVQPSKELWRGAADLSAAFKGGYDEKNLYIQIAVKDDTQKNEQTGANIDFGDSVRLAFDSNLAGGNGYKAGSFELALALAKGGRASGWRRLENGRYLRGLNPIEKDFSVTRNDVEKTTLYQIALPLDYLGIKPEAGKKFGFTFAVQDQDGGAGIDKSICPSAGLVGSREPKLFSQGILEARK